MPVTRWVTWDYTHVSYHPTYKGLNNSIYNWFFVTHLVAFAKSIPRKSCSECPQVKAGLVRMFTVGKL